MCIFDMHGQSPELLWLPSLLTGCLHWPWNAFCQPGHVPMMFTYVSRCASACKAVVAHSYVELIVAVVSYRNIAQPGGSPIHAKD